MTQEEKRIESFRKKARYFYNKYEVTGIGEYYFAYEECHNIVSALKKTQHHLSNLQWRIDTAKEYESKINLKK